MPYEGHYNNKPVRVRKKAHAVETYNVKENVAVCTCGFSGTPKEFNSHSAKKRAAMTLDFLLDIQEYREVYPTKGSVNRG